MNPTFPTLNPTRFALEQLEKLDSKLDFDFSNPKRIGFKVGKVGFEVGFGFAGLEKSNAPGVWPELDPCSVPTLADEETLPKGGRLDQRPYWECT